MTSVNEVSQDFYLLILALYKDIKKQDMNCKSTSSCPALFNL